MSTLHIAILDAIANQLILVTDQVELGYLIESLKLNLRLMESHLGGEEIGCLIGYSSLIENLCQTDKLDRYAVISLSQSLINRIASTVKTYE